MAFSSGVAVATLVVIVSLGVSPAGAILKSSTSAPTQPPVAQKVPHKTQLHGETVVDPYFWMRQKDNPDVLAYLKAENAYTDAMLKPTEALREKLYHEMVARIREDDQDAPYRDGAFQYYDRTQKGKQYRIHCRMR